MKSNKSKKNNDTNLFREMSYELAGDIGAIDNEDMLKNRKLIGDKDNKNNNSKKSK